MLRNYLIHLKTAHLRAMQAQKGQAIIIFTFAFLALVAMLGLALDLGLVYIEKIKVSRTADAAALASVVELPFEEEAMRRAIEYIELNGYDVGVDTEVLIRGCIVNPAIPATGALANYDASGAQVATSAVPITPTTAITGFLYVSAPNPRATFVIDTLAYQFVEFNTNGTVKSKNNEQCSGTANSPASLFGTSNRLRVTGKVNVNMSFMQFFGFSKVPVEDQAVGENVTNLDVVVVFDVSGSMDYETPCFGCWQEDPVLQDDIINNPFPTNGAYSPLVSTTITSTLCTITPTETTNAGFKYLVHEAENYSREGPTLHGWEFGNHIPGNSYWVLQREDGGSSGQAYIRHHPYVTYSQASIGNDPAIQGMAYNSECFTAARCWQATGAAIGQTAPLSTSVPYVEYDFTPRWSGNTHIWIRAQAGYQTADEWKGQAPNNNNPPHNALVSYQKAIFWQVGNQTVQGSNSFANLPSDGGKTAPDSTKWRWLKLGSATTTQNISATLKLYAGSSGFMVDKVIFTNNSTGSVGDAPDDTFIFGPAGVGPAATPGSATREACNRCNPAYGLTIPEAQCSCKKNPADTAVGVYQAGGTGAGCSIVNDDVVSPTNLLSNDLFSDQAPLRQAQEAVKNFARRLDPKFDQAGFVVFSSAVDNSWDQRSKLQCLRWATNFGGANGVAECYDPTTGPITYTQVIQRIENQDNGGTTNISEGLREGLEELGVSVAGYNDNVTSACSEGDTDLLTNDKKSCDRRGAARRVLILMTDGSPNNFAPCDNDLPWRGTEGAGNSDYDCAIWYAKEAEKAGVTLYTIGIGAGANNSLLKAMAEGIDPNPAPGDPQNGFYFTVKIKGTKYYNAVTPADLDTIFDAILGNVFVRIVG